MRILFDTNIFREETFRRLHPYLHHLKKHRILGNPIALNEAFYVAPNDISKPFPYMDQIVRAFSIINDRTFLWPEEIIKREFFPGKKNKYWFETCKETKDVLLEFNKLKKDPDLRKYKLDSFSIEENNNRKIKFKNHHLKYFRQPNLSPNTNETWLFRDQLIQNGVDTFEKFWAHPKINNLREAYVKAILNTWVGNEAIDKYLNTPERYPYFTLLIRGFMFIAFDSRSDSNNKPLHKFDSGCQLDMFQTILMKDCDILVSQEKKFLPRCFKAMWLGQSKLYFSLEEFIEYIKGGGVQPNT